MPFKLYTEKDGLNSRSVYNVIRDDRGLLWVGTSSGINWFDGTRFFQPTVPRKVDQLYVQRFYKDREGIVWTMTFYNGFYKFQNDNFTQYLIDPTYSDINRNNIMDMVEISPSHYAIATDRGLYFFDGKTYSRIDEMNVDGQIETVNYFNGFLLVGFAKGLYCYKYDNGWQLVSKSIAGVTVNRILFHNNNAWIATDKGLYDFDHLAPQNIDQPTAIYLKNAVISDVTADANDEIWFAGNGAGYKLSQNKLTEYNSASGLKAAPIHVYFDHQNLGWFSTYEGLYKLGEEYFSFKKTNEVPISFAKANDRLWISYQNGFSEVSGNYNHRFRTTSSDFFTNLYYAPNSKQLWIANSEGLFVLKDNKVQKQFSLNYSCVYEDNDGRTWIATNEGKLFVLKEGHLQQVNFNCFSNDFVSSIVKDRNGFVWLGFRAGGAIKCEVENFTLKTIREFSSKTGFLDFRVRSCDSDDDGNILFGTRTNGLFIFSVNNRHFWHINNTNGLNATWVTSIASSNDIYYLATNNGLFELKRQSGYDHPQITPVSFPNEEISKQMNCVIADDKQVWIGSNGLTRFLPAKFRRDTSPPPVFITQVNIEGKIDSNWTPYSRQQAVLHLPYNKNVIAFEFTGIHLKDDNGLHYRYKLEGQDKDWSFPTDRNYVSYNLLPGKYNFIVQAQNAFGIWSRQPATYSFIIVQPIWKTGWFIALNILLAIGLVYLIYRYRLMQAMKLERLRYKISTDLHDDIGSTLSSISILSEMALTENRKQQNHEMVAEIKANSLNLLEKMDDIVWSINPKNDSLESLLLRVKRISSKLFEAKDIDYTIEIDKAVADVKLPMEYRQHLYLIMKEAINNLVKYAAATKAAIEVNYHNGLLKVRISDNGRGFDLNSNHNGNGIMSMKSRAGLMNAIVKIESGREGTTIRLEVKIK